MARAAERCHVSQSTLSIQVKKLEETLGVPVFERSTKWLRTTRAGEEVVRIARGIVTQERELRAVGARHRDPFEGELRLGTFPTLAPYWFPKIVPRLREVFPKLRFALVEEKTPELAGRLREGTLDCAVMAEEGGEAEGDFAGVSLFREPFLLAVPASHRLAGRKKVAAAELERETVLLLEEGHCLRGQVLSFCSRIGVGEAGSYRATSLETLRSMVALGAGVTLVPRSAVAVRPDALRYLPFAGEAPSRTLSLHWRKTDARGPLFTALGKALKGE